MTVKLTINLIAFVLLVILQSTLSAKKGYYTIVAPGRVKPDTPYHVSITLNDFHKSCWFNISLTGSPHDRKKYKLEGIEVQPGTTKLVELQVPFFNQSNYGKIEVFGYRGIISESYEKIYFEADKLWVFVQTNKAIYKPGELVKFRIIYIDQLKKPVKSNEGISIEILDPQSNLIKSISDVKFVQGVFKVELQLSEYPVLGKWEINVYKNGGQIGQKTFDVERYVLPKFSVQVKTKKVSIRDEQMLLNISARFFNGLPVKGNVSLTMVNFDAPFDDYLPILKKELPIDGQTIISLDLKKDLQLMYDVEPDIRFSNEFYKFDLEVIVRDDLSEEQARNVMELLVYGQSYQLELQAPDVFDSEPLLNIKVQISIRDLDDNLIKKTENPVEIEVGCRKQYYRYFYSNFDKIRLEYINEIGKDFSIIQIPNQNYSECYLIGEYQKSRSPPKWMKLKNSQFSMDILTESPQEGKELEIRIKNPEPIEEFSYEILSRGDIIQSDCVIIPGNETTYTLRLNATAAMVPKITIYVHLISNMKFIGQMKDVLIKETSTNSIEITTSNETNPGSSVDINITTKEGSYVGLMGIDWSVLQSLQRTDTFNDKLVNSKLSNINSIHFYSPTENAGIKGDIITLSNVFPRVFEPIPGPSTPRRPFPTRPITTPMPLLPPPRLRKNFPESWLFMDIEQTPAEGFNIIETVPDSITTWAITGFSIHPDTGLTFTKNTTNLKVFQAFFVSMDLPSLVKDGEVIEIPVYLSNYMNEDTMTNLTIETDSEDLDILDHPEGLSKHKQNTSKLISAKNTEKFVFFIKPLKRGHFNVTVEAISSVASDKVQKTLNVQPQGIPYAMSKTYLVHLPEENTQEDQITVDIPENAVAGSQKIEVSVVGDIFRPLMDKLQKLVQVPYGNGEDNMKLIISNLISLRYLKTLHYSNPSLEHKIRINLELGYQNQLPFKYLDGSFGLFERSREITGDIYQTILALWGLKQAKEFIHVDSNLLNRGLEYLKSKQQENGCLKSKSDLEEDVKLTAFGLMVYLLDEDSSSKYNQVISKGLEFLNETVDTLEDSPISVMATYALLLGKHEKADDRLKELTSSFHYTDKQMPWPSSATLQSYIKTTAGSLLDLFESQGVPEQNVLQIVRALIVSKKEESSLTHLIALQAMIAFLKNLPLSRKNLNIFVESGKDHSKKIQVNAENSQVLQTFEVPQISRMINLQSKGHGFAVVNVKYSYNILSENKSSSHYSTNIFSNRTSQNLGALKVCSNALTNSTQNKLTIMEVNLQSGFIFTQKDSQDDINLLKDVESIKFNDGRDKVVIFVEPRATEICTELEIRKLYEVLNSKPGWVQVYGAHDQDQKATKSFRINDFE